MRSEVRATESESDRFRTGRDSWRTGKARRPIIPSPTGIAAIGSIIRGIAMRDMKLPPSLSSEEEEPVRVAHAADIRENSPLSPSMSIIRVKKPGNEMTNSWKQFSKCL
jgi:hypothetical protein